MDPQPTRGSADPPGDSSQPVVPFALALNRHGLELIRAQACTLQVNVGLKCNQACKHCHLEAGPDRTELMDMDTVEQVAVFAAQGSYQVIDITGGAPELNPHLPHMIERFASLAPCVMIRSNLTNLAAGGFDGLLDILKRHRVVVVASLPSLSLSQVEAQRGQGALARSLEGLRMLNSIGYGQPNSGLRLDLVCNPTGAFLPPAQDQLEKKYRLDLERKWGIFFNHLFTFSNVPLGRFRVWLEHSGNMDGYMQKLASSFNPCTITGLMCRTLISVSWDGYLYDCDFNLAAGIPAGGVRTHISEANGPPAPGSPVAVSNHCYACTAGTGFT